MSTFRRIAPWLILGPITGLLAEGVHRNIRANNPGLAALYAMAAVLTWIDLAAYGVNAFVGLQWLIF
jgi:hypothetical protein